jgi:hypothetical protein
VAQLEIVVAKREGFLNLAHQTKIFGDGFKFPDCSVPPAPEQEPQSPWSVKQVRGMGVGQAKNVYAGLHTTGFEMPKERSIKKCGSCDNYSSAGGTCLLVPMKFNGSVATVKVTYPACSKFEAYDEDDGEDSGGSDGSWKAYK